MGAYSLGFFFGPGRPRGLAGSVCPFERFAPGLGPGTPFRRGVSPGVTPVAGVESASGSEALSAEEGRGAGGSLDEAGEERSRFFSVVDGVDVVIAGLRSSGVLEKRCRRSGDSFNVRTRVLVGLIAPARLERPFVAAGMVCCGWCCGGRWRWR